MISYLLFGSSKLLNISDITKRIGNFFKLLILLFILLLIPNSRMENPLETPTPQLTGVWEPCILNPINEKCDFLETDYKTGS